MKQATRGRLIALVLLAGLGAGLAGCGTMGASSAGRAAVYITDAASATFSSVKVTIDGIMIRRPNRWVSVPGVFPVTVHLLTLSFQQQLLGTIVLPEGFYSETRLVLSSAPGANTVTLLSDGSTHDLVLPSGTQTGIQLIGGYRVQAHQTLALAIDFGPDKTIHLDSNDKFILRPTIPLIVEQQVLVRYGALNGTIEPQAAWDTAVVSAYDAATKVLVAASAVTFPPAGEAPTPTDGTFRIALPAGTYSLKATATGFTGFDSRPITHAVTVGADTDAGTITLTATP